MTKFKVLFLIVLVSINGVLGQSKLGSWNILAANVKANEKWNFFAEAQLRSLSFYNEFHYYEVKIGANFKIDNQFSVTSGFGSYNTFAEGGDFK